MLIRNDMDEPFERQTPAAVRRHPQGKYLDFAEIDCRDRLRHPAKTFAGWKCSWQQGDISAGQVLLRASGSTWTMRKMSTWYTFLGRSNLLIGCSADSARNCVEVSADSARNCAEGNCTTANRVTPGVELGRGSFGIVYQAKYAPNVVVKVFQDAAQRSSRAAWVRQELAAATAIPFHRNIVRPFDVALDARNCQIIYPHCGMDLSKFLKRARPEGKKFPSYSIRSTVQ